MQRGESRERTTAALRQGLTPALVGWVLLALAPGSASAFELAKGPWLQRPTPTSMTVLWETADQVGGHLRYGTTPELLQRSAEAPVGTHHELTLEGLEPGTPYLYALFDGAQQVGDVYAFRTAPAGAQPFRFVFFGDNRSGDAAHQQIVDAILTEPGVAFVLNTGDMVDDGEVEEQWQRFFEIEGELMARLPVFPTIGNHEEDDGEVPIWERLFAPPTEASGSEHYYAFTWGNLRVIVLDGHVEVDPWYLCLLQLKPFDDCLNVQQQAFVEDALAEASADPAIEHLFAVVHGGPYSSKSSRTGSAQMRSLLPAFLEAGVELILSGHDHYYEHGISANGIHYIVNGAGGAPLYEADPGLLHLLFPHETITSVSRHCYTVVDVSADRVEWTTKTPEGDIIEQYVLGERPACQQVQDCEAQPGGACPGGWSCNDGSCQWICDPPPVCLGPADCPAPPDGLCPGEWRCVLGFCDWVCAAGECEQDADCAGRDALNDCWSGRWQCMDDVCEWYCPPPPEDLGPPPDAGAADLGPPDGGPQDVGTAAPDADPPDAGAIERDLGGQADGGSSPATDASASPPDAARVEDQGPAADARPDDDLAQARPRADQGPAAVDSAGAAPDASPEAAGGCGCLVAGHSKAEMVGLWSRLLMRR